MHVADLRGSVTESRHTVHVAVVDAGGSLVARAGDPELVTFWRSAAKPFQAMPPVEDGVAERFGLGSVELALACASHSSEPAQVDAVRAFLRKIGCAESDLRCGPHRPLSEAVAKDYESRGVPLTAVTSNCSGKHAGMLALAKHHGWPLASYTHSDHPVQRRCLAEVSRWAEVPEAQIGVAVDGCGVSCFALPLRNMAGAYARLAKSNAELGMRNSESQGKVARGTTPPVQFRTPHSAFRILEAMLAHPDLIAGQGRPCTELMRAHPGRVIVKVGAEGVYCALLVKEVLGVALKVEDGHTGAAALAIAAVLGELGLAPPSTVPPRRPITNSLGETVGEMRVNGGLLR